jgi:hypothetical protein
MEIQKHTFDTDVQIVDLGDVHRGDSCCDVELFKKHIDYIQNTPNTYWASTGDLLNVALKHSKSDVYSSDSLEEEFASLISDLTPIKDKCLGVCSSNHHNRFDQAVGMSLDKLICTNLHIPYTGDFGLFNFTCGRVSYYMIMHHGTGGGSTDGAKANDLAKLQYVLPSCDVYLQGHTHAYRHFIDETPYIDRKRNKITYIQSHMVCTGHYLKWENSYAQRMKLKPKPRGSAIITLSANMSGNNSNKKISVDLLS